MIYKQKLICFLSCLFIFQFKNIYMHAFHYCHISNKVHFSALT